MRPRFHATLFAVLIGVSLAPLAEAQQRRSVAIIPTQFYAATASSAQKVTVGLVEQFRGHGYEVIAMERAQEAFQQMKLKPNQPYADAVAREFGRRLGADLVIYPRVLATGRPLTGNEPPEGVDLLSAVLHVRVLNVATGRAIYLRQIRHIAEVPRPAPHDFTLTQPIATAAVKEVMDRYFERVAGSREEFDRTP